MRTSNLSQADTQTVDLTSHSDWIMSSLTTWILKGKANPMLASGNSDTFTTGRRQTPDQPVRDEMLSPDFYARWNTVFQLFSVCRLIAPASKIVESEENNVKTSEILAHDARRIVSARRFERIPTAIHSIAVRDHEIIATTSKVDIDGFAAAMGVETDKKRLEQLEHITFHTWLVGVVGEAWENLKKCLSSIILITNPHNYHFATDMGCPSGVRFVKAGKSHLLEVLHLKNGCFTKE